MHIQTDDIPIAKSDSWKIFDQIHTRYDLVNHVLSFGLDTAWRRQLKDFLPGGKNLTILDLATGTADVLLALVAGDDAIAKAYGIDLSENMLALGREKIRKAHLDGRITLQKGDATQIPFPENTFHAVTIAFGIRNVANAILGMKEMHRTLRPGGRALILEFSIPGNFLIRFFHLGYLRIMVPLLGGMISGNFKAYNYLNRTIEKFPCGERFCRMMRQTGFKNIKRRELMLGTATIYVGDK